MGYTLTAANHASLALVTNLLRTVTHIAADLVLIPLFGFMGPALAANISAYLNNPATMLMLRRIGIKVIARPYVIQTLLLLAFAAFSWWLQPQSYLAGIGLVLLFVILNVLLATITTEDLSLVLPERIVRRQATVKSEIVAEGGTGASP
jgi:O-antigen/teichoic acid export membrane protein